MNIFAPKRGKKKKWKPVKRKAKIFVVIFPNWELNATRQHPARLQHTKYPKFKNTLNTKLLTFVFCYHAVLPTNTLGQIGRFVLSEIASECFQFFSHFLHSYQATA